MVRSNTFDAPRNELYSVRADYVRNPFPLSRVFFACGDSTIVQVNVPGQDFVYTRELCVSRLGPGLTKAQGAHTIWEPVFAGQPKRFS